MNITNYKDTTINILATIFLDTYLCKHESKKSQKCHPTIYVVSLPFFFPQHTIKIIQNKQFFKPRNIYLNTFLTGILGFFPLIFYDYE